MTIGLATMRTTRPSRIVEAFKDHARGKISKGSAIWG
jgi:hypothetical protein